MKLPIAKILNLWGRAEGLLVFTVLYIVGIIILASCNGPNVFAAGYILYWIGYDALYLILDLFIADTFGLRNRAFAFGFASTPFICTAFTGPLAAQSFINHASWRWAYGAFAIIVPVVYLPLMLVFKHYQRKAEEMGVYRRRPSGRTVGESIIFYIREFDCEFEPGRYPMTDDGELTYSFFNSGRCNPAHRRLCPCPPPIWPPKLWPNRIQDAGIYLHAGHWICPLFRLCDLGEVLYPHPLHSI